jgi:septum site-determining protein MinC
MGLEGADPAQLGPELPPLLRSGRVAGEQTEIELTSNHEQAVAAAPRQAASLLVDRPVRSGQTIYFPDGDVSVLGSVGSGAEIVAGGSIHIYGTLRGRAMAGSTGNARARIFCQKIEAELLAINGYYRTADEIEESLRGRPSQAWLDGSVLAISAIN